MKKNQKKWQLLSFVPGTAKTVVYVSRRNKAEERAGQDAAAVWRCNVGCRLRLEFSSYWLAQNLQGFCFDWSRKRHWPMLSTAFCRTPWRSLGSALVLLPRSRRCTKALSLYSSSRMLKFNLCAPFRPCRGVRQGCPLSAMLSALLLEPSSARYVQPTLVGFDWF